MIARLHFLLFLFLGFALVGCASKFKVNSEPNDAEVALLFGENGERKVIGKTPLEMSSSEFSNQMAGAIAPGQFFTLQISKSGFVQENFTLPATRFGTSITQLDVKMKPEDKAKEKEKELELRAASDIVNRLFLAQKFAIAKQFERALIEIDKILSQFPTFARALSMKGSIYLAQQNYAESIKWYDEALKSDPQMEDTVRLAARARELLAGRQPAQQRQ